MELLWTVQQVKEDDKGKVWDLVVLRINFRT